MNENARFQAAPEIAKLLRLMFVGLGTWIVGGVAAFAVLSAFRDVARLSSHDVRSLTLLVGFGLGALTVLALGTVRLVTTGAGGLALALAGSLFLLPPAVGLLSSWWTSSASASLAPGLVSLLLGHAAFTIFRAWRAGEKRHIDRVLVPEAVLLLLGLGLALADLAPAVAPNLH